MEQPAVRGRFAPSPSGRMHLGNAFCCLIAWLSTRAQGGTFVLRIEDLDPDRCKLEYARQLEEDLHWLGLDWDEGGSLGGPHAPYYQRERSSLFAEEYQKLEALGLVYPCFCTRGELHTAEAPHLSDGRILYGGSCRNLTPEQVEEKRLTRSPAMRLRVPEETIAFTDGNYGPIMEDLVKTCGDFILRRSDGVYAYQLAVVADDARMGITQVVRGRDLLDSTPRQLLLYRLLGYPAPTFSHIPLLLAPDGRRLSKRDRDLDLGQLRQRFAKPEEIWGKLAHSCGLLEYPEPVRPQDLIPLFSWEQMPKEDIRLTSDLF